MRAYLYSLMKKILLSLLLISSLNTFLYSQDVIDDKKYFFSGNININNNGVSWVPLFTLGEPSLIANFSFGTDRFSVNPSFRYELEGLQPWNVDIYWNYKLIDKQKINLDIGGFLPGTTFQDFTYEENGIENKILTPWVTAMINPKFTFSLSNTFAIKLSYFTGIPLKIVDRENQFESGEIFFIQPLFNDFKLNDNLSLSWNPEIYYLRLDNVSGVYSAQTLIMKIKNSPLSFTSVISKSIDIGSLSGKQFDWNIGLSYSFRNSFKKVK